MFDDSVKNQIRTILNPLKERVNILYFTQEFECAMCRDTGEFVRNINELSPKLNLTEFDYLKNPDKAEEFGIERIPAIAIADSGGKDTGIRFYGPPAGYEVNSFLSALLETSGAKQEIPVALMNRIKAVNKPVNIKVFISLSCPYCPEAVIAAHRLALENTNIKADMIDVGVFPHLGVKYNVSGVPKIVINETRELVGAHPIENMLEVIEKL
ncbi:MAG: thioredoxin family protein [Spirochaetes bacterium]|nr:thioredoxin family protein [Spirochaetota bacterium]